MNLQEKTKAAAAPRKPKKGAVSSPLKVDMFFLVPIGSVKTKSVISNNLIGSEIVVLNVQRERTREFFCSLLFVDDLIFLILYFVLKFYIFVLKN